MITLLLKLFATFFQIGLFGFGGGYAMLSMIQSEVVYHYGWMTTGQFTDIVAISQMTPGPIGINSATYVGYTSLMNDTLQPWQGVVGSLMASLAVIVPSFILMLLISRFMMKYKEHPIVQDVFKGLRPAVVGLLASAALMLLTRENFSTPSECPWQFWCSIGLFLFAFFAQRTYKMNPILIIILCAVAGIILF